MKRKSSLVLLVYICFPLAPQRECLAVSPVFWNTSSFAELSKGSLKGLSLSADGQLSLAPKFDPVFDSDQALIWSAVYDSKKNLFIGTGHDGKVFKVDAGGSSSLFFDAAELDVLALALDADQTLYVATSPDGKVYKVSAEGKGSVFFDPEDKFIWDMAFDAKGQLFVATGNKGRVYRVGKDGKAETLYDSGQSNITCVAVDSAGNVLAGSDPDGYVYRISPEGKAFVLYDSAIREVHEIQLDSEGNIYFVAVNATSGSPSERSAGSEVVSGDSVTVSLSSSGPGEGKKAQVIEEVPPSKQPPARASRRDSGGPKSGLFRIAKDNSVETLWTSETEAVYGMYVRQDGTILFSTGNKGRIYLLRADKKSSLLLETAEEQTTKLLPAGSDVFACTSNLAKIYRLGNLLNNQGNYESEVKDSQGVSSWGSIHWRAAVPDGTSLKIQTRSGNTKKPDKTWSEWSKPYTASDGDAVQSPRARYIQYRVAFATTNQHSPSLEEVSLPYLQQNFAPEVKSISILPAGVAFQRAPGLSTQRSPSSLVDQGSAEASGANDAIPQAASTSIPPRRIFQKGAQSLLWESEDHNGDEMVYSVYFRGESESEWRLLKRDLEDKFFTLEADTLPDGKYVLKVVASDGPSNPKTTALSGELVSTVFHVDNTPPQIQVANQTVQGRSAIVRFRASDTVSPLRKAELSLDGKDWEIVFSVDGIVDSKAEEFEVKTGDLQTGDHVLALRVYDSTGNVAIGKATLRVK
jgi:SMP-30/Gluconolactonase/LRE-like region